MPFMERAGKPAIHYTIDDNTDPWGEKKPFLVLQHGYSRSGVFFGQWVPYHSRFYRVVRSDLRGLGQSPLDFDPDQGISAENFISDISALIDHLGGGPVHYVGESLGGILGIVMGATIPEKFRSITLLAAPLTIPKVTQESFACGFSSWQEALRQLGSKGWSDRVNGAHRFPPDADPEMVRWYSEECGKSDVNVLIALSRVASKVDVSGYMPQVRVPMLGLYPTAGVVTRHEEAQIRAGIPGIRIINFPTPYHAIQVLMPAACAKSVLHFCGEIDGVPNHE